MGREVAQAIIEAGFSELQEYGEGWQNEVLSAACAESGLPPTVENKLKVANLLESDLECEFHGGDS